MIGSVGMLDLVELLEKMSFERGDGVASVGEID